MILFVDDVFVLIKLILLYWLIVGWWFILISLWFVL